MRLLLATVLLALLVLASDAWMPSCPQHRIRMRWTTTQLDEQANAGVEHMKDAWKTWQEEKLNPNQPIEDNVSALQLTQEMLEMALDFVRTGKQMEEDRLPDATKSYQDLTEVEEQLAETLQNIKSKEAI